MNSIQKRKQLKIFNSKWEKYYTLPKTGMSCVDDYGNGTRFELV